MSQTIDNRIVEMQFENKQFESGVQESLSTLDKLKNALRFDDASKNLQDFSKNVNKNIDLSGLSKSVEGLSDKFSASGIAGMEVIRKLTDFAIEAGKTIASALDAPFAQIRQGGWKRAMNIEDAKFQLKGLNVAWETVSSDIDYAVADTAYGLDVAAKACAQLSASSVQAGSDMKAALRGISGVAAMGNTEYENISRIFTKAAGNGKVMAQELNMISQYGLNARASLRDFFNTINDGSEESQEKLKDIPDNVKEYVKSITKGLKVTESDINDFVHDSKINFQTFSYAMDNAFGEHAKKANETFFGALSNIKAALSKIGAEFATPIIKGAIPVFNEIRIFLNDLRKRMAPLFETFKNITELFSSKITDRLHRFAFAFNELGGVEHIGNALKNVFTSLVKIITAIANAFTSVFPPATGFETKIMNITEAIENFSKHLVISDDAIIVFRNILVVLFNILKNVISVVKAILPIIGRVATIILNIVNVVIKLVACLTTLISKLGIVQRVMDAIRSSGGLFAFVVDKIRDAFLYLRDVLTDTSTVTGRFFMKFKDVVSGIALIIGGALYLAFMKIRELFSYFDTHDPLGSLVAGIQNLVTMLKGLPVINTVINGLKTAFGIIGTVVSKVIGLIKDFVTNIKSGMSVAHAVGNTLGTVVTGMIGLIGTLSEKIQSIFSIFKKDRVIEEDIVAPIANANTALVGVEKTLTKTGEGVKETTSAFDKGKTAITNFGSAILDKIRDIRAGQVLLFAFGTTITILAANLVKLTQSFSRLTSSAANAVNGLGIFFRNFGVKRTSFSEAMISISIAIGTLTASLWAMSKIPTPKLLEVAAVLEVLLITMGTFSVIGKSGTGPFAAAMLSFSGGILLLVSALYALDQVNMTDIEKKWATLAVISGIVLTVSIVLSKAAPQLSRGGLAILTFAGAVYIIAKALSIIANSDLSNIKANWLELSAVLIAFGAFASLASSVGITAALGLISFLGVLKLVSKNTEMIKSHFGQIQEGFKTIVNALKGAISYLYDGLKKASEDMKNNEMFAKVISGASIGIIGTLLGIIVAIGHAGKGLKKAAVGFAIILASIAGVMYVTAKIGEMVKNINDPAAMSVAINILYSLLTFIGVLSLIATVRDKIKIEKGVNTLKDVRKLMTSLGILLLAIGGLSAMVGTLTPEEFKRAERMIIETEVIVGIIALLCTTITAVASKAGKSEISFATFAGIVALLGGMLGSIAILMYMFSNIDFEKDKQQLIAVGAAFGSMVLSIVGILGMLALLEKYAAKKGSGKAIAVLGTFGAIVVAMSAVVYVLSKQITNENDLTKAGALAGGLLTFALVLSGLVVGLEAFSRKLLNTKNRQKAFAESLAGLGVMLIALGELIYGLVKLQDVDAGKIWGQITALTFALTSITALVLALQYFEKQTKFSITKKSQSNLIKTFAMIGVLVLAFKSLAKTFAEMKGIDAGRMWGQTTALLTVLTVLSSLALGLEYFTKKFNIDWSTIGKITVSLTAMMALFAALSLLFKYIIDNFQSNTSELLARSQTIMLVMGELSAIVFLASKFLKSDILVNGALAEVALAGMVALFMWLTNIFKTIDGLKTEGIMAKSQTIILLMAELIALIEVMGFLVDSGAVFVLGAVSELALWPMIVLFGLLAEVFIKIDGLKTEGIMAKSQTIILVMTELIALIAIMGGLVYAAGVMAIGGLAELALWPMINLFGLLADVFVIIDGLKTEGIMAKSQTIILVMTELIALIALMGGLVYAAGDFILGGLAELALWPMINLFGLLADVFVVIDALKTEGIMAKSQTIILVMTELIALIALMGAIVPLMIGGGLSELALWPMIGLFGKLTEIFILIDGMKTEGLLAKSQAIILVLLELEGLSVLSILSVIALAGGPGLDAMIEIFGKLTTVFLMIDQMHLEGLSEKADIIVATLLKLEGLSAIGGLIGTVLGPGLIIFAEGIQLLGIACNSVGSGLISLADGIDRLVIAVNNLVATGPGIRSWFTEVSLGIMAAVSTIGTSIMSMSVSIVMAVNTLITGIANAIKNGKTILFGESAGIGEAIKEGITSKLHPLEWGKELVGMFASGIKSGIGLVADAAASIAKTVWSYLHFSNGPDVGAIAGQALRFFGFEGAATYAEGWSEGKGGVGEAVGSITSMISDTFGNFDVSGLLDVSNLMSGKEGVLADIQDVLSAIGILKKEMASLHSAGHGTRDDFLYQLQQEEKQLKKNKEHLQNVAKVESNMGKVTSYTTNEVKLNNQALAENEKKQKELTQGAEKTATAVDNLSNSFGGLSDSGKKTKEKTQEIKDEIADFYDSIQGAINLFEEFNKETELTSDKLLENMRSQIAGVSEWADQIQKLAFMGIDQGLLQQLADMGPQGYEYTNAFVHMTAEQLAEANNLYHQSLMLPSKITSQVYGSYTVAGRSAASGFLQGLQKEDIKAAAVGFAHQVVDQMNIALDIQAGKSMVTYEDGVAIVNGVKTGITEGNMGKATDLLISNDIKKKFNDGLLNNNYMYTVGKNITQGLANGVEDEGASNNLVGAVIKVCDLGKTTAMKATKAKSPSRVFMKIGNFITLGLAKGITDETQSAVNAMDTTANSIIDTMRETINKANAALTDDVDAPVITPILDLSEIQDGSRQLNNMLSRNSAFSASSSFGRLQNEQWNNQTALLNATMDNTDVVSAIGTLNEEVATLKDVMTNLQVVLDTGTMVGAMTPAIDQQLGMRQVLAGRGI